MLFDLNVFYFHGSLEWSDPLVLKLQLYQTRIDRQTAYSALLCFNLLPFFLFIKILNYPNIVCIESDSTHIHCFIGNVALLDESLVASCLRQFGFVNAYLFEQASCFEVFAQGRAEEVLEGHVHEAP